MTLLRTLLLCAGLAALPAAAQTAKTTTEQQARSYILSAFMTGSAPAVLSEGVKIPPALRERLALAPDADSRAVYYALVRITAGRSLTVRPAKIDELERSETQVETGKPVFALDVSDTTFVLAYDLERDLVTQVADASRPVAVTSPVAPPEPPQSIASTAPETPAVTAATPAAPTIAAEPEKPAAEPAAAPAPVPDAPAPSAAPAAPVAPAAPEPAPGARVQVVEPREPNFSKPAARAPALTRPEALQTREEPRLPPLKPNGACVVKPVMSDQDLVNCGARLR